MAAILRQVNVLIGNTNRANTQRLNQIEAVQRENESFRLQETKRHEATEARLDEQRCETDDVRLLLVQRMEAYAEERSAIVRRVDHPK